MKKLILIILCTFGVIGGAFAQRFEAQGVVTDSAGEAVIGATVIIKGTTTGAITNYDGSFRIEVPNNQAVLQFSFLGLDPQEMTASTNMKIVMQSAAAVVVPEVVVQGMFVTDKRLFTGATDNLVAGDVKIDGMSEISRALEGRSAGVSIQNVSGSFGAAPKIRVRGATSIYGDSKPLWVVDGIVMEDVVEVSADDLSSGDANTLISSAIAGLNADDIESIQVLKDGSATSIYGAKAMAGVIVVTTKRGKAGAYRLNYTGEYTMRMIPSYSQFNIMNSQEQMEVYQELYNKGWLNFAETVRRSNSGIYGKMYQLMDTYDPQTGVFMLPNTEAARNNYLRQGEYRNTDWFKELFNVNVMHSHAISMSGGSEKATFYSSMSALVDPGWTRTSKVNRYTANINGTFNLIQGEKSKRDILTLSLLASAAYRTQQAPGTLGQAENAVTGDVSREFDINPYSYALNTSRTLDPNEYYTRNYAPFNIKHELDNNKIDITTVDVKFQSELKWKIIQGLEWSAIGAVKYNTSSLEHHIMDESNQAIAYRTFGDEQIRKSNTYLYSDPDQPNELPITILPNGGIYKRTDNKMFGYDFRTQLSWNQTFKKKHILNAFAGMEVGSADRAATEFTGWGRQYSMGDTPFYVYEVFKRGLEDGNNYYGIGSSRTRNVAFVGTATYSYDYRYTLNGTVRYEGSNKLGRSRTARWLPTWNVSGAWNVHEESFFKKQNVLSHFTFKASYSLTANHGPSSVSNSRAQIYATTPWRPSVATQENALYIGYPENSELTYEKKHELNLGVDFGFLDGRIGITFDWYMRNNFDLIGPVNTMGLSGSILKMANVASMKTGGVELAISTVNIKPKTPNGFGWNTTFIFAQSYSKITALENNSSVMELISGSGYGLVGYPQGALFSVPFVRLSDKGTPIFLDENGNETSPGNSVNLQNRTNVGYLNYEGPSDPTMTGSLGNVFSWKGFKLNIFITYSFGNKIRLAPAFRSSYTDLDATPREFINRWMLPGDEKTTNVPTILTSRSASNTGWISEYNTYNYTSERIADGGFIRMKEISLSYDFPQNIYSALKMTSLGLKIQATNPFMIYSDKKLQGQDPEFFRAGGVSSPVPQQFTLTLRIGF